jgi:uncharacterized membrane protein
MVAYPGMMTDAFNPYAPPQARPAPLPGSFGVPQGWRLDADRLVARKGAVLPAICIWTGLPTEGMRVRRKLAWAPPWIAIFALSPIIYLIVYFIVRKTGDLDYTLGEAARKRRRAAVVVALGGLAAAIALVVAGIGLEMQMLVVVAIVAFVVAAVTAAVLGRTMQLVKIDKEFIYLKLPPAAAEAFARASAIPPAGAYAAT